MEQFEGAGKLDRCKFHLEQLRKEQSKNYNQEQTAIEAGFAAFLNSVYTVDEQLKKLEKGKGGAAIDGDDRSFLDDMINKRGADVHNGVLRLETKAKSMPAEECPGVSVAAPLLPVTEAEAKAADAVGMKPGWAAGIMAKRYYVPFKRWGEVELLEACERCLSILERRVRRYE